MKKIKALEIENSKLKALILQKQNKNSDLHKKFTSLDVVSANVEKLIHKICNKKSENAELSRKLE